MSDRNIFGQPVILSSSKPNWADLAIERAAEIERLRAEIERLRAALREIRALFVALDEALHDAQRVAGGGDE